LLIAKIAKFAILSGDFHKNIHTHPTIALYYNIKLYESLYVFYNGNNLFRQIFDKFFRMRIKEV